MKKRYMFTLTKETMEEFQALCKEIGLPPATISNEIDRYLHGIVATIKKARAQGKFTLADMFTMMGEQVELVLEEENAKKRETKGKKGNGN